MERRNDMTSPDTPALTAGIVDALDILADVTKLAARLAEQAAIDDEEHAHSRHFADQDVRDARLQLQEAIIVAVLEGEIVYDEALTFFAQYEFEHDCATAAELADIVRVFKDSEPILIKQPVFYDGMLVRGKIVGHPILSPYADVGDMSVSPVIIVDVDVEGVVDGELIKISLDRHTGQHVTRNAVVGADAIEAYLQESS